jgi:hypothetical protein
MVWLLTPPICVTNTARWFQISVTTPCERPLLRPPMLTVTAAQFIHLEKPSEIYYFTFQLSHSLPYITRSWKGSGWGSSCYDKKGTTMYIYCGTERREMMKYPTSIQRIFRYIFGYVGFHPLLLLPFASRYRILDI